MSVSFGVNGKVHVANSGHFVQTLIFHARLYVLFDGYRKTPSAFAVRLPSRTGFGHKCYFVSASIFNASLSYLTFRLLDCAPSIR
eukprot:4039765-Pyramimonas_sp.AAC.1